MCSLSSDTQQTQAPERTGHRPFHRFPERRLPIAYQLGIPFLLILLLAVLACPRCLEVVMAAAGSANTAQQSEHTPAVDRYGDPLPPGARHRLGTVRYRSQDIIRSLAYTPDGQFLVGGCDGPAIVWDAVTGKVVRRIGLDLARPHGPAYLSPDGKYLAVGGGSGSASSAGSGIYELATGRLVYRFGRPGDYTWARYSPDGKSLAVFGSPEEIEILEAATGKPFRSLKNRTNDTDNPHVGQAPVFSKDSKRLVSASSDRIIRWWDLTTGKLVKQQHGGADGVRWIGSVPDSNLLASIAYINVSKGDGLTWSISEPRVRIWDMTDGKQIGQIEVPGTKDERGLDWGPCLLARSSNNRSIVTGGSDSVVRMWDLSTRRQLPRLNLPAL